MVARRGIHGDILLGAETWRMTMNTFYEHHQNSIRFGYHCFDRILINASVDTLNPAIDRHFKTGHHERGDRDGHW
jgi:hypothetical protein